MCNGGAKALTPCDKIAGEGTDEEKQPWCHVPPRDGLPRLRLRSPPPAGCLIKGNINLKTGDRVYHVPGQIHYDNVTIEPERGEMWFCTESEALANGWKRAKR